MVQMFAKELHFHYVARQKPLLGADTCATQG